MFLHACFIPCIFSIIAFVIVPSKQEFVSGFPYILLTTTLTCEGIDQTVIIAVKFMFYLETFACCQFLEYLSKLHTLSYHIFQNQPFFLRSRAFVQSCFFMYQSWTLYFVFLIASHSSFVSVMQSLQIPISKMKCVLMTPYKSAFNFL